MLENIFGEGTRARIVEVISKRQPVKLKVIYSKIRLSPQAVHKVVKQLESDKVLIKKSGEYSINPKWIKTLEKTVDLLKIDLIKSSKRTK